MNRLAAYSRTLIEYAKRSGCYGQWSRTLAEPGRWTNERLRQFQDANLCQAIKQAVAKGLLPADAARDFHTVDDMARLPLIDKLTVRRLTERNTLQPKRYRLERATYTGGSTGVPLRLVQSLGALQREQAFIDRIWSTAGFDAASRVCIMRGNDINDDYQCAGRWLCINGSRLSYDSLRRYVHILNEFKPDFIHCYPSILHLFATYIAEAGEPLRFRLKAVLCGSEPVYPHQTEMFKAVFQCGTVSWYGNSEQAALARRLDDGSYFFAPQYGYVEFIDAEGGLSELVGSGWVNPSFPLIRYRTGDLVEKIDWIYDDLFLCEGYRVNAIIGRQQESVLLADGQRIPFNHLIFGLHGGVWSNIREFCFIQTRVGLIELQVVPNRTGEALGEQIERTWRDVFERRFGERLRLEVSIVNAIERALSGKAKYFQSAL